MHVYLFIINDFRCGPRYLIFDSQKKAEKYFLEMVDAYNEAYFYDEKDRTLEECVKDLSWSNGRDSIRVIKTTVNNKKAVC